MRRVLSKKQWRDVKFFPWGLSDVRIMWGGQVTPVSPNSTDRHAFGLASKHAFTTKFILK